MLALGTRAHKANAKLQYISLITKYFCKKVPHELFFSVIFINFASYLSICLLFNYNLL